MRNLLFIFFASCLFQSCSLFKEEKKIAHVSGQVIDYYTGKGVSGISLLVESCRTPLVVSKTCIVVDTLKADTSGFYQYSAPEMQGHFELSTLASNGYAPSEEAIEFDYIKETAHDFKVKPLKVLKVVLTDTSHSSFDSLYIQVYEWGKSGQNNTFKYSKVINNLSSDNRIYLQCIPDSDNRIDCICYKSKTKQYFFNLNTYCNNVDTCEYELKY